MRGLVQLQMMKTMTKTDVGLHGGGSVVRLALHEVACLLESGLLGVGLHGSTGLVGERLAVGVRHDNNGLVGCKKRMLARRLDRNRRERLTWL